ncbi:hypothetical protein [Cerasicoccus arenae]|uniref:Lipoprotein n=1 Tax=Cerasicoccus arenae TaxID=424488 RepID=A0A8J3DD96_9BACT|nr:hypothetical protein [Cerasicoccus arenae]MBK1858520.1 hypothetical protein [Cerasicoccus arenae]GHC06076.1 hypothetical protein GCM10007047_23870 [Cerasicoccus arenae]
MHIKQQISLGFICASLLSLALTGCQKPTPEEQMGMGAKQLVEGHQDRDNGLGDMETAQGTENLVEGTLNYLDEGSTPSSSN